MVALAPKLTLAVLIGPVLAGLFGTVLPAIGFLQPGGSGVLSGALSAQPLTLALDTPGLLQSSWLSVKTGMVSTFGALAVAMLLVAGWHGTRWFRVTEQALSPLLSVPHAAAALGLVFLIAPSGWLARLASPTLTGWDRPPDILVLQDPGGWALILGLVAKELPFLLLMLLAALPQVSSAASLRVCQALGYGRVLGWMVAVAPQVYAQIRLPVYAVLAYGMSNVDVALVLGPNTPPTLAMRILQGMSDPDLNQRAPAAVLALYQLALVAMALGLWRLGESMAGHLTRRSVWRGWRLPSLPDRILRISGLSVAAVAALSIFTGLITHAVWSVAGRWRFPDALPEQLKLRTWMRHGADITDAVGLTLSLALTAALISLMLTVLCLEAEHRSQRKMGKAGLLILYLPLILPQITFLPGLQILLLKGGVSSGGAPVLIAHVVFVLPYVFLTLAGPFRAWDARYATLGATLGASADRTLWRLRLPMLLRPLLTALAVGMAVSVGQYLPTLLASGGRLATLTTEALALASGGDRRAIGAWALALTLVAWGPFMLALALPSLLHRNRKGMSHG
nr:ABC transporter permease subunit [Phaeobacter sp.]